MKRYLIKLLKLKSIITILMVLSLIYGWITEKVTSQEFIPLVTMILTFYFANQKKGEEKND